MFVWGSGGLGMAHAGTAATICGYLGLASIGLAPWNGETLLCLLISRHVILEWIRLLVTATDHDGLMLARYFASSRLLFFEVSCVLWNKLHALFHWFDLDLFLIRPSVWNIGSMLMRLFHLFFYVIDLTLLHMKVRWSDRLIALVITRLSNSKA